VAELEAEPGELVEAEVTAKPAPGGALAFQVERLHSRRRVEAGLAAARSFLSAHREALGRMVAPFARGGEVPGPATPSRAGFHEATGMLVVQVTSEGFGPMMSLELYLDEADRVVEVRAQAWFLGP
jgi:hypothetical protein